MYGETFHKLKVSETFPNISRKTSVIRDLSYIDGKFARAVEGWISTVKYQL